MKQRPKMEPLGDALFRELSEDECRQVTGGFSKKITGKITFETLDAATSSADGEADVEFDF